MPVVYNTYMYVYLIASGVSAGVLSGQKRAIVRAARIPDVNMAHSIHGGLY